jgi:hypothetical protein
VLNYTFSDGLEGFKNKIQDCAYLAPLRTAPLAGTLKDVLYEVESTETCTTQPPSIGFQLPPSTEVQQHSVKGVAEGVVNITVPAGTFTAFKYTATTIIQPSKGTSRKMVETCWTDLKTGRHVACDTTFNTASQGDYLVRKLRLEGYSTKDHGTVGNVSQRFAGDWVLSTSSPTGDCTGFTVNGDGAVTGACDLSVTPNKQLTGKIDSAASSISITLPNGVVLTGTFSSPANVTGKFTGLASGTWTATRR